MFPSKERVENKHRFSVILGVGGNVGDVRRRMEHLWVYLGKLSQLKRVQSGVILKNPPFGYTQQDDFYNTVIEISTSLSPRVFLRLLWRIEKPRTLDLDVIFYGDKTLNYPELSVPHPHWKERSSVVIPLRSMARNTIRRQYENLNV
jgi:2-amino-4-hydroxy-6-hydroxymethyldihydropteridine diphosphokinase